MNRFCTAFETFEDLICLAGTAVERVEECARAIREKEGTIGAFVDVFLDDAKKRAAEVDAKKKKGKAGKLAGLVCAVKNNIAIKGKRLTCASKMLENYVAPYTATIVERLLAEDAIIIGTTNLDEFACGSDTTHSAFKPTKNPVDPSRVPGGSSGGSAAAVAAGFCDFAIGSDTGGSIRCPASFCGVAGFKSTYGMVSRYGLADMAMSFDQIGPLAPNTEGVEKVFEVIAGEDPRDPVTAGMKFKPVTGAGKPGTIGIPSEFFEGCDKKVESVVRKKILALEQNGWRIKEMSVPMLSYALPVYYLLVYAEFGSAMQKYDGLKYGAAWKQGGDLVEAVSEARSRTFGREVKRRILLGTYITTKEYRDAWYTKTLKARDLLKTEVEKALKDVDLLAGPAMPSLPWKFGEKMNPLEMYLADVLTVPANVCGLPAGVVKAGAVEGLPVGIQFMGREEGDAAVLSAMKAAEKA